MKRFLYGLSIQAGIGGLTSTGGLFPLARAGDLLTPVFSDRIGLL